MPQKIKPSQIKEKLYKGLNVYVKHNGDYKPLQQKSMHYIVDVYNGAIIIDIHNLFEYEYYVIKE